MDSVSINESAQDFGEETRLSAVAPWYYASCSPRHCGHPPRSLASACADPNFDCERGYIKEINKHLQEVEFLTPIANKNLPLWHLEHPLSSVPKIFYCSSSRRTRAIPSSCFPRCVAPNSRPFIHFGFTGRVRGSPSFVSGKRALADFHNILFHNPNRVGVGRSLTLIISPENFLYLLGMVSNLGTFSVQNLCPEHFPPIVVILSLFAKLVRILIPSIVVAPVPPFAQMRTQLVGNTTNPYHSFREY